jgi:hypothetical protein
MVDRLRKRTTLGIGHLNTLYLADKIAMAIDYMWIER